MPEFTMIEVGLLALMLFVGLVLGWIYRSDRCGKEKIAINASWQQQLESQQSEHNRLAGQNKSLMEQISQYQASSKDSTMRARELSDSLKETFARRDDLQQQIKDIRSNLEVAVAQRERIQTDMRDQENQGEANASAMKEKDDKIFRLSRELQSWQDRVPPLVERFRERDEEARQFEVELEAARNQLAELQVVVGSEQTRIEPVDADSLPDGMDASNEPHAQTSVNEVMADEEDLQDDVDAEEEIDISWNPFGEDRPDDVDDDEEADPEPVESEIGVEQESHNGGEFVGEETGAGVNEGGVPDDLKKIKGVGPAIEKTLNELGILRFHQIAEMSEYDIDRVAQQLKGFRSRIYREDWIGQARTLQYQKNAILS